uniref:EXS domain-containing protein n=1 Tax=Heterorhabditis bacteriophora TaxID=37862 RepID=A0A1I7X996_HETBA
MGAILAAPACAASDHWFCQGLSDIAGISCARATGFQAVYRFFKYILLIGLTVGFFYIRSENLSTRPLVPLFVYFYSLKTDEKVTHSFLCNLDTACNPSLISILTNITGPGDSEDRVDPSHFPQLTISLCGFGLFFMAWFLVYERLAEQLKVDQETWMRRLLSSTTIN